MIEGRPAARGAAVVTGQDNMPEERTHPEVRDAVARLCTDFPDAYWRDKDRDKAYPASVKACTNSLG